MANIEQRTLHKSDMQMATGELVTIRTLGLVFDPDAATDLIVSENYRPRAWGIALYTPAPENALLEVLCTYDDPVKAVSDHQEAVSMVAVGTNDGVHEPTWAERLSWTGPGQ